MRFLPTFGVDSVARVHLGLQRIETLFVVFLPLGLIFESSYANGWAYTGGSTDVWRVALSMFRGFFFEVLTYGAAKCAKLLFSKRQWVPGALISFVALWAVIVSAGNNLGWVMSGHDLAGLFASMGKILPGAFLYPYELGLALLLPLSVAVIALVDVKHLVEELIHSNEMAHLAMKARESEMHRRQFMQSLKEQTKSVKPQYDQIAKARVDGLVSKARAGDLTFSVDDGKKASGGAVRVSPVPNGMPALPTHPQAQALPAPHQPTRPAFPPMPPLQPGQAFNGAPYPAAPYGGSANGSGPGRPHP